MWYCNDYPADAPILSSRASRSVSGDQGEAISAWRREVKSLRVDPSLRMTEKRALPSVIPSEAEESARSGSADTTDSCDNLFEPASPPPNYCSSAGL